MNKKLVVLFSLLVTVLSLSIQSFAKSKTEFALNATSDNPIEAKEAITSLRSMGAEGLQEMFEVYEKEITQYMKTGEQNTEWLKIAAALDAVSMQKDSYSSRLYWHTDFERAKLEAQKSSKPILSLYLLGNLNEEYSCANSRFFRSILYSNDNISKILRERFVLHWKSVRPAPRITIDFGDGRKLVTTITGNSIHYVLDSNGQPIDALPGLYGPAAFQDWLLQTDTLSKELKNEKNVRASLYNYHTSKLRTLMNNWRADLNTTKANLPTNAGTKKSNGSPSAVDAAPLAVTKMVSLEGSILRSSARDALTLEAETKFDEWKKIAALHQNEARINQDGIAFIKRQLMKYSEEELKRLVANLEGYVALDTVRNEYLMHRKLHSWFLSGFGNDLNSLNEKVYAELFLTPSRDPWLGLYSPDTFTAIDGGAIR